MNILINTSRGRQAMTAVAAFAFIASPAAVAMAAPQNADATDTASATTATNEVNTAQSANAAQSANVVASPAEANKAEAATATDNAYAVATPNVADGASATEATGNTNAATGTDSADAPATADGADTDRAASGGGITITNVETSGNFGDKFSVGTPVNIKINYEGKGVQKGAEFGIQLGDGLILPPGFTGVPLKATALSGEEKVIGQCTASAGNFKCTVTEDPKTVLGGNGDLKNGFVKLEATLDKSSTGKTETDIVVDGVTHKVNLGKGVTGEPVTLDNGKFCSSAGMAGDDYSYWCWVQAKASGGSEVSITENRQDATWKTGVSCVHADATADWTKVIEKPKAKKDGQKLTFTAPDGGDWVCRIGVSVTTSEKTMTNEAAINDASVSSTTKWRARGSSGADTDEDVTPPAPEPTPEPSTPPTPPAPDVEKPPAPTPSEPPAPEPTPEPSTPPAPEQPKPPAPVPTPEPSTPPAPEQPKPPAPVPTPEPSTPPAPEQPKPPAPVPSNPPTTPPAPEKPKPNTPPAPQQPKPPVSVPSKPSYDAPKRQLAHTGANAGAVVGGAAALAAAGVTLLIMRKRRQG